MVGCGLSLIDLDSVGKTGRTLRMKVNSVVLIDLIIFALSQPFICRPQLLLFLLFVFLSYSFRFLFFSTFLLCGQNRQNINFFHYFNIFFRVTRLRSVFQWVEFFFQPQTYYKSNSRIFPKQETKPYLNPEPRSNAIYDWIVTWLFLTNIMIFRHVRS